MWRRWRLRAGAGSVGGRIACRRQRASCGRRCACAGRWSRTRSGLISLLRATLRQDGLRVPSGSTERILERVERLAVPAPLSGVLVPVREVLAQVNATLATAEAAVEARATQVPVTQRLMTAPGVGPCSP
jgi:transposase